MRAEPSASVGGRGRRQRRRRRGRRVHPAAAPPLAWILFAACAHHPPREPARPAEPEPAEAAPAVETPVRPDSAAPAPPEAPPPEPAAEAAVAREVRICAGGDVLLGNNLDTLWARRASARLGRRVPAFPDPDALLAPLRPLVRDADVVLLNVEGAIGEGPAPQKCRPGSTRCYAFRQPGEVAAALAAFARPAELIANVANNHAMDAGPDGFTATIAQLRRAAVHVTGADTLPTLVVTSSRRDTVALLGFSTFRAGPDARDLAAVRRHVARAAARYPRLVVSVHMGAEGRTAQRTADRTEIFLGEDRGNPVAFAHAAVEAGASLVVGHGPHVLRAAEWRDGALILYSLGNLLTYGPFKMSEPLDRGAIVCASLDAAGEVTSALLRSTRQRPPGLVSPDPSGRGAALVDSLGRLDFPRVGARVRSDGALLRRPTGPRGPSGGGGG